MHYIGRFISTAKQYYKELNRANLNGAIDVIVVQCVDGNMVSSPFFVQFGKSGILMPSENEVEITVNGIVCSEIKMRLNKFGQAYFDDKESNQLDSLLSLLLDSPPKTPQEELKLKRYLKTEFIEKCSKTNDQEVIDLSNLIENADFDEKTGYPRKLRANSECIMTDFKKGEQAYYSDVDENKTTDSMTLEASLQKAIHQWQMLQSTPAFNLSSDQLKKLNLHDGANKATFSVATKYQGTCNCECSIHLWKSTDQIVISDIDGTITKSDVLGHLMPLLGLEWIHPGVVQLYRKIVDNGFRIMYVSARAIGQAYTTRQMLEDLVQGQNKLPSGAIILSPNSLLKTIQMEMILKRPQELKIVNLKRIMELFQHDDDKQRQPFIAGFGNRTTDIDTYRAIGIPNSKIFIVNPQGGISTGTSTSIQMGYNDLSEIVDTIFPVNLPQAQENPKYSNFMYWKSEPDDE